MAGAAPPVMLMICWLVCGPSVKRENGIETEIPGCKMKFELSNRKKTRRKTRSTSAKRTSQPKLYSFVRLSFMRRCSLSLYRIVDLGIDACLGLRRLLGRLKANDTTDRPALLQHVNDLNPGALHVVEHGVHARREIAISDKGWHGHDQTCCSRQQALVNAAGKLGHRRVTAT